MDSVITLSHTASDDLKFHLIDVDLWMEDANVHIETNSAKYGNFDKQEATILTVDITHFVIVNLRDIYFKNAGAAANTTIIIVGVRMLPARMKELELI